MKRTVFFVLIVYCIAISDSRLLKKVTKTDDNERKPTNVSSTSTIPPVRLRRYLAIDNYSDSMSKEEQPENVLTQERRNRYFIKDKKRVQRNSNVTTLDTTKFNPINEKVLVKKPIPKYTELDDYELEPKAYRLIPRFVESDENEDEDFNVDDYDFDIKHDEFVGRGKPIIPRTKEKEKSKNTEAPPVSKYTAATITPIEQEPLKNKTQHNRQRSVNSWAVKPRESKEDTYDYEISTIKMTEKDENSSNEDIEDGKEVDRPATRRVRSPWHKIMLPQRMTIRSSGPSKRISILPMFPGAIQRREKI